MINQKAALFLGHPVVAIAYFKLVHFLIN